MFNTHNLPRMAMSELMCTVCGEVVICECSSAEWMLTEQLN